MDIIRVYKIVKLNCINFYEQYTYEYYISTTINQYSRGPREILSTEV